jgi:hypothetical protein
MVWRTAGLLWLTAFAVADEPMPQPAYTGAGELVRPTGHREWMFVGANIGMGYNEGAAPREPRFHHIYIQREAYKKFAENGTFPDKTMLVMEVLEAGSNESINRRGQFAARSLGVEVALKDEARFPEKWAYFNFIGGQGKQLASAKAFPKQACWNCHNEHGAADNVFVQFYPALREALEARPKANGSQESAELK